MKDISIIIVNYNVRYFLARCLDSIFNADHQGLTLDVFVVDNASVDGSVEMIREDYPQVKLIASEENLGFAKGNNLALRQMQSRYALLLNPDTLIEEDTLRICYDYMESHPEVGALGVKMIDGTGKFLPESKRSLPTIWNSTTKLLGLADLFPKSKLFNSYALGHLDENETHDIQVLCGAFMFMPTEVLDKVGLLDEAFFMYGEDIDLSYRILKAGYKVHYLPETKIIHYKGESTKKSSLNYVKTFYGAMSIYVQKHYQGTTGKLLAFMINIGIMLRAGLSVLRRSLQRLLPVVTDAVFLLIALFYFGQFWASYRYRDPDYFSHASFNQNILTYAVVLPLALAFLGYYKKYTWVKRLQGIVLGGIISLAIYALLPESYRSSRIILIFAVLISILSTFLTSLFFHKRKEDEKKIIIVAQEDHAAEILQNLDRLNVPYQHLGNVQPDENLDGNYINNITALDEVVRVLKADEVIFHAEDMSMKSIMNQMVKLGSKVRFKIAGDDHLSIIGSNSKNNAGELYSIGVEYNLADAYHIHIKRSFDFLASLGCILLSPILLFANGFKIVAYFKHMLEVLIGTKTMVGYVEPSSSYKNLPLIKQAIIPIAIDSEQPREVNLIYARDYSVWKDAETFIKNLNRLA